MATVRIQVRRGTSTQWTSANPTLAAGEIGVETNTRKVKIGDGTTTWTSLDYIAADSPAIGEIAQDAINDALSMGSGLTKSYNDGTNTITVSIDDSVVALKSYVNSEITATEGYADSAVSAHNAVTTSVHGIANTADLATQDYVDNAVSTLSNTVDTTYIPDSEKGQPNGVATLNSSTKIPNTQIDNTYWATVAYADQNIITAANYTDQQISNLVDGSPTLLNTLNELAAAINDDANFSSTITTSIGEKVAKSGDTMTGFLTLSADPTSNLHAATKNYVDLIASGIVQEDIPAALTSANGYTDAALTSANGYTDNAITTVNASISTIEGDVSDLQTGLSATESDITTINGTLSTLNTEVYTNIPNDIATADTAAIASANNYADSIMSTEVTNRDSAISTAISTEVTNRNSAISTAVAAHESDTTSVHGIADTSALATKTYADGAVSTHNDDTTSVHGITDTSALATKTYSDDAVSTHNSNTSTAHGVTGAVVGTTNTQTLTNKTLTSPVINSPTGIVKADVGLSNVDNTSDANKPVSTATQSALDLKANLAGPTFTGTVVLPSTTSIGNVSATEIGYIDGVTSAIQTQLNAKAPLASPTFTGTVNAAAVTISGNLTVSGTTTTVSSTNLEVSDPMIYMGGGNTGNAVDLGIVSSFNDGTYQHSGLVRDASDSKWKLFKGVTDEPTTTVNFTQGSLDALAVGAFEASSATIGNVSNTELQYLDGVTSAIQTQLDAKTTASKTETFTNKSISLGSNTVTTTLAQLNTAVTDADVASLAGTETLTNKTLTSPAMTSPTVSSGTLTVSSSGIVFTDGTQTKEGVPSRTTINPQTAAYTVALADRDSLVEVSSASAVSVTIPLNSAAAFPVGTSIDILQTGAGQVSIVGTAGVTINATPQGTANTAKLRAQWSSATLFKRATDTWVVLGDLTA